MSAAAFRVTQASNARMTGTKKSSARTGFRFIGSEGAICAAPKVTQRIRLR